MKWPWRREPEKPAFHTVEIELKPMLRKLIYDSGVPEPEVTAQYFGLPATSPDVVEMEVRASLERRHPFGGWLPMLLEQSKLVAAIVASEHFNRPGPEADIPGMNQIVEGYAETAFISSVVTLSILKDLGLIDLSLPKVNR